MRVAKQKQTHMDEGCAQTAQRGRGVTETVNLPVGRVGQRQCRWSKNRRLRNERV